MKTSVLLTMLLLSVCVSTHAQDWMNVHRHYDGQDWSFPLQVKQFLQFDFSADGKTLRAITKKEDDSELVVPFSLADVDSIDFSPSLTDEEKGHNKYRVFTMNITTEDGTPIQTKEDWMNCYISIDGKGEYSNFSGIGRIRGRGNSSWLYYKKKPYKFKLDEKSKLLGLEKAKNWNLLSNYRDVTDMMNVFAFETAHWMGMPHTNHTRFVEVFLNGEYIGVYQLTEKIEIQKNRVDIDKERGLLMVFDQDDGPNLSPDAHDNFWSEVYNLPMCVKEPEDLTPEQIDSIKSEFAILENVIKRRDYEQLNQLVDIPSFISILQLHEFVYNVEIDAPRSLYVYRDKDGKYTFGPVWDYDAAYDFDWNNWTENHTYFSNYKELIYGKDPLKATSAAYHINKFFRDMFGNSTFVKQYKQAWAEKSDSMFIQPWAETQKYIDEMKACGAYQRDVEKWPLKNPDWWGGYYDVDEEIAKMSTWLKNRKKYLDNIIAGYPEDEQAVVEITEPTVTIEDGKILVSATMDFAGGYSQNYRIKIAKDDVVALLGGEPRSLVSLDNDGSVGRNTAAGTYGAWFDEWGDTNEWGWGHVYIESNDLYSWKFGCHPDNCRAGDQHTVMMRYQSGNKKVDVIVTFTIK
ncbi:MAG: CotH kinase family protein [Bacteroidaceae bacterium]|nr:CotH kinase family protein [Bacteroidaceae bacterium]